MQKSIFRSLEVMSNNRNNRLMIYKATLYLNKQENAAEDALPSVSTRVWKLNARYLMRSN